MSPAIAACVIVAFIYWLLHRHSKSEPAVLPGLWVVFVWLAIMESKPVFYWFASDSNLSTDTYLDGSPFDRNILLVLITLAVVVLFRRGINFSRVLAANRILLLFYLYLAVSVVWSDYSFVAFKRWFKDFGSIMMILVILTDRDPITATRTVFTRCAYLLVPLSVLFIKWFPDIGRYYHRWTYETLYCGVTTNKNSLGLLAMIGALVLLWRLLDLAKMETGWARLKAMAPDGIVLLLCLWLLQIAQSATSLGGFLLGTAIILIYHWFWTARRAAIFTASIYLFLALSAVALVAPGLRGAAAETLGRDPTLTTRTDIWEAVLNMGTDPFFGEGFASVWLTPKGAQLSEELRIPHAHNGYIETYLNSGMIGVCLLLAVLLVASRNARKMLPRNELAGAVYIGLFVSCVVFNYTEATFNNGNVVGFTLMLLAVRY